MGFVGTACTDVGLSLTRDNGPFQTADTLTHEIGHKYYFEYYPIIGLSYIIRDRLYIKK